MKWASQCALRVYLKGLNPVGFMYFSSYLAEVFQTHIPSCLFRCIFYVKLLKNFLNREALAWGVASNTNLGG